MNLDPRKTIFTESEVVAAAHAKYGKAVCTDQIKQAMRCKSLGEAVEVIIADSLYWDGDGLELLK